MTQSPDIVTLLEQPYRHDLPAAQVRAALLTALAWPTSYWPDLAVGWIEHGAPVDMEVQIALAQVAMNSHFPQRLRHRAFALTRKRKKSAATGANVMTCQLSVEGSALWAGMADIELITPDGRHQIYLGFEGEPPHGDSYHSIWFNNVQAPGYAWGCLFACTPDSRFLAMSWMEKLFERKTAVFDLEERRYFGLPLYLYSFRFRWPRLESTTVESDGRWYAFDGSEVWRAWDLPAESE